MFFEVHKGFGFIQTYHDCENNQQPIMEVESSTWPMYVLPGQYNFKLNYLEVYKTIYIGIFQSCFKFETLLNKSLLNVCYIYYKFSTFKSYSKKGVYLIKFTICFLL